MEYTVTYGGYDIEERSLSPDVFITDGELSLLFHSGIRLRPNDPIVIIAAFDPYRWTKPLGEYKYFFYRTMFCLLAALIDERPNGPKNRQ